MSFDQSVIEQIGSYVYALFDPRSGKPFYVGKGQGNRVFQHVSCAIEDAAESAKLDTIRQIHAAGQTVRHVIVRHGLSDQSALEVESALIDWCEVLGMPLSNLVSGHGAETFGAMTTDEVIRAYSHGSLTDIPSNAVIININGTYRRRGEALDLYEATRSAWVISERRRNSLRYALAEFRGVVVEVFEIERWLSHPVEDKKKKDRWEFIGKVAQAEVRDQYRYRIVPKKRGAANPIRYSI